MPKLGSLDSSPQVWGNHYHESRAGAIPNRTQKNQLKLQDERANLAHKLYQYPPYVDRHVDGRGSVDGVRGRFVGEWFLPYHLEILLPIPPSKAAWMRVRILNKASFEAGPIKVLDGDEIYRLSTRFARCIHTKFGAEKFFSLLTLPSGGIPLEVEPAQYDVLVRMSEPYAQYHSEAFYPYIAEAHPRLAESMANGNH
ncbi:uncharacterized protein LOC117170339 [Belonocnema kinseyi]|uniref:uncharacterized protein LOC117170339 n=1 Tax=Belonocnema kinseyi TaxID=2817044 RepID=UPI00143DB6FF|nr:uncharacterized protein LOC117170339 [Belonocnema kinseyi]